MITTDQVSQFIDVAALPGLGPYWTAAAHIGFDDTGYDILSHPGSKGHPATR